MTILENYVKKKTQKVEDEIIYFIADCIKEDSKAEMYYNPESNNLNVQNRFKLLKWIIDNKIKKFTYSDCLISMTESSLKLAILDLIDHGIIHTNSIKNEFKEKTNFGNIYTDPRYRAKKFLESQPLYYDINGFWWKWNSELCYWEYVVDDIEILNLVYKEYQINTIQRTIKTETLEGLKQEGRKNKPEDIKDSWVQYGKVIYDIATGESFESTPKYFNTNPIFVNVGDSETTPYIDKLFNSWVLKEDVPLLYEKIAFATIPKMIIHSFDVLYGPPGTGKSTFTNFVEKFVGSHNTTATSVERLNSNPRFETLKFHKKLLIKISEVSSVYDLKNSAVINNATGEDSISAEKKGGKTFEFVNYGKFFNPTNKLLKVDPTDGFGRRVRVLKFNNRFETEKDVLSEIPEIELQNLARKCLRIASELWKVRKFTRDKTISERILEYQNLSKSDLEQFIDENYITNEFDSKITFMEFKKDYSNWLKINKKFVVPDKTLASELTNELKFQMIVGNQNVRFILGLKSAKGSLKEQKVNEVNEVNHVLLGP